MFKVKVISQGACREEWLKGALKEYEKRVKHLLQIEWLTVETAKELLLLCQKEPRLIALDVQGELLSSEAFSAKWIQQGVKCSFVIGGSDGLPKEIVQKALWRWSLSPLTFPHQIVKLLLIEQLYRALEIHQGKPYHK